jgi:hypothetical protein
MARRTALMVVTLAGMAEHMVSMIEKSGGEREREEREEREAEWANNSASWAPARLCCGAVVEATSLDVTQLALDTRGKFVARGGGWGAGRQQPAAEPTVESGQRRDESGEQRTAAGWRSVTQDGRGLRMDEVMQKLKRWPGQRLLREYPNSTGMEHVEWVETDTEKPTGPLASTYPPADSCEGADGAEGAGAVGTEGKELGMRSMVPRRFAARGR